MSSHDQKLIEQQRRAVILSTDRRCPHCKGAITLLDALSMVRGHGYTFYVTITLPSGKGITVPERDFNPQTMLWASGNEHSGQNDEATRKASVGRQDE
jgi:glutaredoxin